MEENKYKVLGVITARGGSKGIPRKNIKELCGKPLIAYTIEAAQESGIFDRLILSTDDEEITEIGRRYGAEIPFMRPAELAQDTTPHLPVMRHAVRWLQENEKYFPDYVSILQPTAPLRQSFHLREAFDLLVKSGADSVVSVVEVPGHTHPLWTFKLAADNLMTLFHGEPVKNKIRRRQDLPHRAYYADGAIYIFRPKFLFDAEPSFYGDKVAGYIVEPKYGINIDGPEDWESAEKAIRKLQNENKV